MANNNLETTEKESKQYIVVMVGSEQYGIDISYIDNIVRMQKITRVPKVQTLSLIHISEPTRRS